MRILAVSDSHGRSLSDLLRRETKFDLLVILGDYDKVNAMHQVMRYDYKYISRSSGKKVIALPGNHERALADNFVIRMIQGDMEDQNVHARNLTEFDKFYERFQSDSLAKTYVEGLLLKHSVRINIDEPRFSDAYRVLLIHGALDGSAVPEKYSEGRQAELWYRLDSPEDHEKNFARMRHQGLNVMIRGHDRIPEFAVKKGKDITIEKFTSFPAEAFLDPNALQTITVGSYKHGCYVLIETNPSGYRDPRVRFERLPSLT